MEKREYVVRSLEDYNRSISTLNSHLQDLLNEMGATGHRLVGFTANGDGYMAPTYTVILERPVEVEE